MALPSLFDLPRMPMEWPKRERNPKRDVWPYGDTYPRKTEASDEMDEPYPDPPEPPLATERQNGAETGSTCGPSADPPGKTKRSL